MTSGIIKQTFQSNMDIHPADECLYYIRINGFVCPYVLRYTSGDVRLWDTLHWDSAASYLKPNSLSANTEPRPYVNQVQVNSTVAAAAYEDGKFIFKVKPYMICI